MTFPNTLLFCGMAYPWAIPGPFRVRLQSNIKVSIRVAVAFSRVEEERAFDTRLSTCCLELLQLFFEETQEIGRILRTDYVKACNFVE